MSSSTKESVRPPPPEGSCHFYVERKRRFCRFQPSKNSNFCAEHTTLFEPNEGKKRVLCPYNPKHTCFETKLNHHMKKCPSRPMAMPPYYSEGINSGDNDGEIVPEPKATVISEPLDVIENLIAKVEKLHQEHIGHIVEDILSHSCMNEELNKKDYGTSAMRQRKQQASLIGQMEKSGMLRDGTCYLEMGAGKGQMSHWLHAAVEDKNNIGFVLIERSHVRNKMDNLHKEEDGGHVMERVRIDIEHLKLEKVTTIEEHDRSVVAFGKHLCGGATDLALRCVVETLPSCCVGSKVEVDSDGSQRKRLKSDKKSLSGVAIAVCCHHRCSWTPYVGKSFFKACGLTAKDFQIISSMSSWATCAWKGWSYEKKRDKEQQNGVINSDKSSEVIKQGKNKQEIEIDEARTTGNVQDNDDVIKQKLNQSQQKEFIKSGDRIAGTIKDKEEHLKQEINGSNKLETNETDKCIEKDVKTLTKDGESKIDKSVVESDMSGNKKDEKVSMNGLTKNDTTAVIKDSTSVIKDHDNDDGDHKPVGQMINARIQDKLTQEQREEIGRKCKQLIDYGRVLYLREHDMDSGLKIYIDEFYTPENVVLLANSR